MSRIPHPSSPPRTTYLNWVKDKNYKAPLCNFLCTPVTIRPLDHNIVLYTLILDTVLALV